MHPVAVESETPAPVARGVVAAIPARWGSQRLPGKPLRRIAGVTLIERVWRRVRTAPGLSRIVVLTDDERIRAEVERFGGDCEMTPTACASGTDRIAWAARDWRVAAVVNVQGDEPMIDPAAVGRLARHLTEAPNDPVVTLAAQIDEADLDNPDVVKVVCDLDGYALYFSRAGIPYRRGGAGSAILGHIGVYGYQHAALLRLAALAPSPLERRESLEQLRALENGVSIRVLTTGRAWKGIDTIEDLQQLDEALRRDRDTTPD